MFIIDEEVKKLAAKTNFRKDISDMVSTIKSLNSKNFSLSYFESIPENFLVSSKVPRICMMGYNFPEEIIHALGCNPTWPISGSLQAEILVSDYLSRDIDPLIKSQIGFIETLEIEGIKPFEAIVLTTSSDSERKMVNSLSKTYKVITAETPVFKDDPYTMRFWSNQIKSAVKQLEEVLGKKLKLENLVNAIKDVNRAKKEILRLKNLSESNPHIVPSTLALFIVSTYYMVDDIRAWTYYLNIFNDIVAEKSMEYGYHELRKLPKVVLMGSPYLFPNFKVPLLLEESGLTIDLSFNPIIFRAKTQLDINNEFQETGILSKFNVYWEKGFRLSQLLDYMSLKHLKLDINAIDINDDWNLDYEKVISKGAKGVVFNVIKGNTNADVKVKVLEKKISYYGLSNLTLETDYNYEDKERLKIRIQAYVEIIKNRG